MPPGSRGWLINNDSLIIIHLNFQWLLLTYKGRNDTSNPGAHRCRTKSNIANLDNLHFIFHNLISYFIVSFHIMLHQSTKSLVHIEQSCVMFSASIFVKLKFWWRTSIILCLMLVCTYHCRKYLGGIDINLEFQFFMLIYTYHRVMKLMTIFLKMMHDAIEDTIAKGPMMMANIDDKYDNVAEN